MHASIGFAFVRAGHSPTSLGARGGLEAGGLDARVADEGYGERVRTFFMDQVRA